jgi:DNA-binding CsgD family transcriptional regulator/PAS domain-containing protein
MDDKATLSPLIGDIYDAALDPALWTDVLASITDFVGGQAGGLLSKDPVSKLGHAYYHVGVAPHYAQIYEEKYVKFDPTSTLPFFDIEQVVSTPDLVPYDEFLQGRFFREWAEPQGFVDAAMVVLEKSVTGCAYVMSIMRRKESGMVDDAMRRRMALIVPHVRRAVLIGKVIDLEQAEAASFADTLDGLGAALFLVDANGRIVHANTAALVVLGAGDVLRAVGGRLVADDAQVDQSLGETFAAADNGDAEIGIKGIALPLTARNGERYVAHVLPLTAGARRRTGTAYTAAAALFVRKAALEIPSPPEVIAKTSKLTPTELRVLLAIVEVGGVPEVAAALGVADTTVKTHLSRVFKKTGVARQADLVKLVAGYVSPVAR